MTRRIGLGMMVMIIGHCGLFSLDFTAHYHENLYTNATSVFDECIFYSKGSLDFNPYYLIPVIVVISIGELLTFTAVLEFICAQSPYSMRGLLIGTFFFIYGLISGLVALVILTFAAAFKHTSKTMVLSCGSSYTLGVLAIGTFGLIFYIFIARWYRRRQRGGQTNVNSQAILEDYFEKGLTTSTQIYLNDAIG